MNNTKTLGSLVEGSLTSEGSKLYDKTMEQAFRASGLCKKDFELTPSKTWVEENGRGVVFSKENIEGSNVVESARGVETQLPFWGTSKSGVRCVSGFAGNCSTVGSGIKNVEGVQLESKIALEVNGEGGNEKFRKAVVSPPNAVDSVKKIESPYNGISLVVEVTGPAAGHMEGNLGKANYLNSIESKKSTSLKSEVEEGTINLNLLTEESRDFSPNIGELTIFSLGDFVWVETKIQPYWWPGRIYPSDVSNDDKKESNKNTFLVSLFGVEKGHFCSPTQLRPFNENFQVFSNQTKSKSFLQAVEKALNEIGREVRLDMTCSCFLKQTLNGKRMAGKPFPLTRFESENFLSDIKNLARDISMPNMLEFTVIMSRLSAYYHSLGRLGLRMDQLKETSDFEGSSRDVIMNKNNNSHSETANSNLGEEKKSGESEYLSEHGNNPEQKSRTRRKKRSEINGGNEAEGKTEKGFESRERKKSKYLSYPYINLSLGHKSSVASGEEEREKEKESKFLNEVNDTNKVAEMSNDSPSNVNKSDKKKKGANKSGPGVISAKLNEKNIVVETTVPQVISELKIAALDCLYPEESSHFCSTESFVSLFRRFVYNYKSSYELYSKKKGSPKDSQKVKKLSPASEPELKKKTKKKKSINSELTGPPLSEGKLGEPEGYKCNNTEAHSYVKLNVENGVLCPKDGQLLSSFVRKPERKKRKKKEVASVGMQNITATGLPDLNGNNSVAGAHLLGHISEIPDLNGNGTEIGVISFGPQEMDSLTEEGQHEPKRKIGSLKEKGKPEPKKRKRKEKPTPANAKGIPDLNGNNAEPSSASGQPKKRRRKGVAAEKPEITVINHNKGTGLLLTFASDFPLPSKEDLASKFSGFGSLNESETRVFTESPTVQIAFLKDSDAVDALRSLEISNPFGPGLVNCRLCNVSLATVALPMEVIQTPAKAFGLSPCRREVPSLGLIRQNLEMMTLMLEKSGNNLSPDIRNKLEGEIKGLLKKVSTIVGESSSS